VGKVPNKKSSQQKKFPTKKVPNKKCPPYSLPPVNIIHVVVIPLHPFTPKYNFSQTYVENNTKLSKNAIFSPQVFIFSTCEHFVFTQTHNYSVAQTYKRDWKTSRIDSVLYLFDIKFMNKVQSYNFPKKFLMFFHVFSQARLSCLNKLNVFLFVFT